MHAGIALSRGSVWRGIALAVALGVTLASVLISGARAAPRSFELSFEGHVGKQVTLGKWLHEGSFTASPPFCPAGRGIDVSAVATRPTTSVRVFTCEDGTGTITVRMVNHEAETTLDTKGTWQIAEGTGSYTNLRGKGEVTGVPLSGDPQQPETLTFRATWHGIADFDEVAPVIVISRLTATKLRSPSGAYVIRIAFSTRDDVDENRVRYGVRAYWQGASRFVVSKGQTRSGEVSVALRIRPTTRVRRIELRIQASDPLGNERIVTRPVRLPS